LAHSRGSPRTSVKSSRRKDSVTHSGISWCMLATEIGVYRGLKTYNR
jgi:hypothetical protein